jgi:hypothetical protein
MQTGFNCSDEAEGIHFPVGSSYTRSGQACLAMACELLGIPFDTHDGVDDLETLKTVASALSTEVSIMKDWPEVDAALAIKPVILIGNAMALRAHGKRLGMEAKGVNFLMLSRRVSTRFPTKGGPFATETVSYLAHDPHYPEGTVWLCLGELRGYCDAVSPNDVLGIALGRGI